MLNKLKDFTYDAYVDFLALLKQKYRIVPFCEVSTVESPYLILRHDVDASLEAALKMATLENTLGIKAAYFVLFSHKLYNLQEKDSFALLKKISDFGHEIGLHYDMVTYESYGHNLKRTLTGEISLLENLLNKKCYSIACHNVSLLTGKDPFRNIEGYMNAYNPRFCENYVSDSCRTWHPEHLSQLLDFKYEKAQLLIHPVLWTDDVCEREAVLERLFQQVSDRNSSYKASWLELWHKRFSLEEKQVSAGSPA